ncbi:MAG: LytTR family DNA-binding domain-containing protein [Oscillospiraceae bacterium]|nr:LytTR family DNA-binding domain-containing protein [Oscillospiraceae bacterium]
MMRVAICEDDTVMLKKLCGLVKKNFKINKIEVEIDSYQLGEDTLKHHRQKLFDLLFLDLIIPDIHGFDIAKYARQISGKTLIVFITTADELVYSSFDFNPFSFIPKLSYEFIEKRLAHVIKNVAAHLRQVEKVVLTLPFGEKKSVPIGDITYIKSDNNYINYVMGEEEESITVRETVSAAAERLAGYGFVRIDNRVIVNLKYVRRIDYHNHEVILSRSGQAFKISRRRKKDVDDAYIRYLKST